MVLQNVHFDYKSWHWHLMPLSVPLNWNHFIFYINSHAFYCSGTLGLAECWCSIVSFLSIWDHKKAHQVLNWSLLTCQGSPISSSPAYSMPVTTAESHTTAFLVLPPLPAFPESWMPKSVVWRIQSHLAAISVIAPCALLLSLSADYHLLKGTQIAYTTTAGYLESGYMSLYVRFQKFCSTKKKSITGLTRLYPARSCF